MKFLVHWFVIAIALWVTAAILPGVEFESTTALAIGAIILGLVNALVRPILTLLTLPITILTLGLFYLCVNGAMLYLAAALTPGFELAGFGSAVLGAIVISIVGMLLGGLVEQDD